MSNPFLDKFNQKVMEIDANDGTQIMLSPIEALNPLDVPLYNIWKRTLPVGMNKPVLIGLTYEAANKALSILKVKERRTIEAQEQLGMKYEIVYYDVIEQGHEHETNVFWNSDKITI